MKGSRIMVNPEADGAKLAKLSNRADITWNQMRRAQHAGDDAKAQRLHAEYVDIVAEMRRYAAYH